MRAGVVFLFCTLVQQALLSCVTFTQCEIGLKQTMRTYRRYVARQIGKKDEFLAEIHQRTFRTLDVLNARILEGPRSCESYYVVRYSSAAKNISEICEEEAMEFESVISDGGFPAAAIANNDESTRALYCNDQVRRMNEYCDFVKRVMEDFGDCDVARLVTRFYAKPWFECLKLAVSNHSNP